MSIEKAVAELLGTAAAPFIAAVEANTEALNRVAANQERLIAGQQAAIDKIEGAKPARETAAEKKTRLAAEAAAKAAETAPAATTTKSEPAAPHVLLAAPNAETTKNDKQQDVPTVNYRAADFTRDPVKNEFIGWLGETDDKAIRAARAEFVQALGQHFGVKQPFAPEGGLTDADQFKQALFFLRRKREGLAVDFGADYDFDADPLADQTAETVDDGDDALASLG